MLTANFIDRNSQIRRTWCVVFQGHIHYLIVKTFASALSSLSTPPEIKTVLQRLCDLYALHGIFTSAGDFLQHGYLSGKQLDLATTAYLGLLADLR